MSAEDGPLSTAREALSESVESLLKSQEYDDLSWLPGDFSYRLMEIAWKHRAAVDGARFKRELRAYIREIAPDEGQR